MCILVSVSSGIGTGVGKTLLRKVIFDDIKVFIIIAFPLRESVLVVIFLIWFSILFIVCCQFVFIVFCMSLENCIANIFVYWYCCKIAISGRVFFMYAVWSVFMGNNLVFSKFIVEPVAFLVYQSMLVRVWWNFGFLEKNWSRLRIDLFLFTLCNLELLFLQFVHCCLYVVTICPCITYNGKERGQPCLSPLSKFIGDDKKPLFIIKDVLFLYKICINVRNNFEKPNCVRVLFKKSWSILSKAFCWSICNM